MEDNQVEGEGDDKPKYKFLTEELEDQVKKWFDSFDKDRDGQIQTSEIGTILRIMNLNPTERELQKMTEKHDSGRTGLVNEEAVKLMVDEKLHDTDTIEEMVEALKCFDNDKDGKVQICDLRWAMTQLGEKMDDAMCDDIINEADPSKQGYFDIMDFAKALKGIK
ncbi:unnamed protein product [Moneuplotes crassus]|uniref:Calmodulin n=2 Tax=Euplotes crassus TaxID=5936 RepID=A0AAD1Y2R2_EUPCR|nr:unnamed protein product [Moneuplotes crassus]